MESRVAKWKYFRNILKTGEIKCYYMRIKQTNVRKMILDGELFWNIFKLLLNVKFVILFLPTPIKKDRWDLQILRPTISLKEKGMSSFFKVRTHQEDNISNCFLNLNIPKKSRRRIPNCRKTLSRRVVFSLKIMQR